VLSCIGCAVRFRLKRNDAKIKQNLFSFEAPSGVDNREVDVHYCCPICFEASSGFDILSYFTIFPVSCVRFLIHFRFCESFRVIFTKIFVIFATCGKLFSRKAKINFPKIEKCHTFSVQALLFEDQRKFEAE
jgi:hypothetical protein